MHGTDEDAQQTGQKICRRAFLRRLGLTGILAAALLLPLGCVGEEDEDEEDDD